MRPRVARRLSHHSLTSKQVLRCALSTTRRSRIYRHTPCPVFRGFAGVRGALPSSPTAGRCAPPGRDTRQSLSTSPESCLDVIPLLGWGEELRRVTLRKSLCEKDLAGFYSASSRIATHILVIVRDDNLRQIGRASCRE